MRQISGLAEYVGGDGGILFLTDDCFKVNERV